MTLRERFFASPFYDLLLRGKPPMALLARPDDPWPGEPAVADRFFQGRYRFGDEEAQSPRDVPWLAQGRSLCFAVELHSFAWLRHFRAAGGETAQRHVRSMLTSWLGRYERWQPLVWRADVLGRRVQSWCGNAALLMDGADPVFRNRLLMSLAAQTKHLARDLTSAPPGAPRLIATVGLCTASLCLPGDEARLARALALLEKEISAQILPDGGHVSRDPSALHALLRDMVGLRLALVQAGTAPPAALQHAIDRMAPMLRFFRHGDGGLALFHGSFEDVPAALDLTLQLADARGKPLDSATQSGFERLVAKRSLVIADTAAPPQPALGGAPHASLLAFEFSHGKERLFVNCGAAWRHEEQTLWPKGEMPRGLSPWTKALAATAAHCTLTVAETNAFDPAGEPPAVLVSRDELDGAVWLELSHDGYRKRFGLTHKRRIYLAATGEDLRGEETLDGPGTLSSGGRRYAVRFHLHPGTQASLLQNGTSVLVKTATGQGWQFRAAGGAINVEESVYFGRNREQRHGQQIVLSGMIAPGDPVRIKWAFAKVAG